MQNVPNVSERPGGKLPTTTVTNELARAVQALAPILRSGQGDKGAFSDTLDVWLVWDAGPNDEADTTNHTYWLRKAFVSNAGATPAVLSDPAKFKECGLSWSHDNWILATNLSERPANTGGTETDGNHNLEKGTAIGPVWAEPDGNDPSVTRYVFQSGVVRAVLVKVTTAASGGGKYNGRILRRPASVVSASGNLAETDMGSVPSADDCLILNGAESGQSTHDLTDVYPVTANRDVPLANVGIHMDEERRVHGKDWPNWTYIQDFGGPDTEGGKWAQPLPHEVRCMTFIALVHRASAILYFSYWPQAPQTWASITQLNRDIERIVPWLIAKDGREVDAKSSEPAVQARARKVGDGWLIIAVNTRPGNFDARIDVTGLADAELRLPYENRVKKITGGTINERFAPFEVKVYLAGTEPE